MPVPKEKESEKDFVNRCIPYLINEGKHPNTDKGRKAAAGECYGIYRNKDKHKGSLDGKRELLFLNANIIDSDTERSTILIGDSVFNGIYFPSDEIEKAFSSWDKKPINLDHSDKVEDIVGYVVEPKYDKATKKLSVKPVLDDSMHKTVIAKGYIDGRKKAGGVPEVSVGVWMDKIPIENFEERTDGAMYIAHELQGDHLAIVSHGACSPEKGCGIGLSKNDSVTIPVVEDKYDYDEMRKKLELETEIEKEKNRLIMEDMK